MMRCERGPFGRMPDGTPVERIELEGGGLRAAVIGYGATLQSLWMPGRDGRATNIVLGADTLAEHLSGFPAAGATIGRVANRIAHARFTLEGREYRLPANEGPHHLHGGPAGFGTRAWQVRAAAAETDRAWVTLGLTSPDGDQGYPGTLAVEVTYTLAAPPGMAGELRIEYAAEADRATPVNLTNHAYFNLAGEGDVLGHTLWLEAAHYTPTDDDLIPTGAIASVHGTPLDFTTPAPIGARLAPLAETPALGYDHNLVLGEARDAAAPAAWLLDPASGRRLTVFTSEPGIQLYSGNRLGAITSIGRVPFGRHGGVCLETQHYPDAVHHPAFPSIVLAPARRFRSVTRWQFAVLT